MLRQILPRLSWHTLFGELWAGWEPGQKKNGVVANEDDTVTSRTCS